MVWRRWLTFRLSSLFLAVTVAAIMCALPRLYRQLQFQRFKSFAGLDIRKLSEAEQTRFAAIVSSLIPSQQPHLAFLFKQNWYVWQLQCEGKTRFVLFQGQPISGIPGISQAHVHLFDAFGRVVGQSSFSTGWRIDIDDAAIESKLLAGETVIVVRTSPVINGADIAKQYYAVQNDNLVLIRMEDSQGVALSNDYGAPNHTIGPEVAKRSEWEWMRGLSSSRVTDVLSTLVWIGGDHARPIRNPGNVYREDFDSSTLHVNVCQRADVKQAIVGLASSSSNRWIKEAAQLALKNFETPQQ